MGDWEEGRERTGLVGPEEEDPKTLPWPLNLPEDEDEKGLLTFFIKPFILSFMSSMVVILNAQKKLKTIRR